MNAETKSRERETLLVEATYDTPAGPAAPSVEDPLLCNMDLDLHKVFFPLGFAVEIWTNRLEILDVAEESWGRWRRRYDHAPLQVRVGVVESGGQECPAAPTARANRFLLSMVADAENQALCDLKEGIASVWLNRSVLTHPSYLRYHFIESVVLCLVSTSHVAAIHAACVSRYGTGVLLCGASGSGKSTLAYACARAGWVYTADDSSYLLQDTGGLEPRVIGNSFQFRFRPSASSLFPELAGRSITPRAEGKPSVEVATAEFSDVTTGVQARVDCLVMLRRGSGRPPCLRRLPQNMIVENFRHSLYPTREIREIQLAMVERLLGCPGYELHYDTFDEALSLLDGLARSLGIS